MTQEEKAYIPEELHYVWKDQRGITLLVWVHLLEILDLMC